MDATIQHGVLRKKSTQKENVYNVEKEPRKGGLLISMNNLNGGK